MKKLVALACLFSFPLQSCYLGRSAINEPLDIELVRSIKVGTSARQVVEKMGAPDEVVQLGKRTAYRYSHTVDKGTGAWLILVGLYNEDTRRDMVWFFFDENENLSHVGSTFQAHRAGYSAVWTDIYDEEDAKAADEERAGK